MIAAIGSNSQVLWYATRGTGLTALVLLTATVVLGVSQVLRWAPASWPRFVVNSLHRNVSLLALAFLALHVATTVLDTFVHISLWAAFVPFVGSYHRFWLGLGAIALDLMVAVVVTSLVRDRLSYRTWRVIHWAAYACWPLAVLHGLELGTDRTVSWVLGLNGICALAVLAAVVWRLAAGPAPATVAPAVPSRRPVAARRTLSGRERSW